MSPTVTLAGPEKTLAVVDPFNVATSEAGLVPVDIAPGNVDPRIIFLSQHWMNLPGSRIAQHDHIRILQTVELLNDYFIGVSGPLHARKIVVTRVSRNIEPTRRTSGRRNHTDAGGRVSFPGLWIREGCGYRIERRCVVDERHLVHAFRVQLPVSNLLAVRAPTKTVAAEQLFFVYPIKCSIDDVTGTVGC